MLTSSSVVPPPLRETNGASLAQDLFTSIGHPVFVGNENRIVPSGGYPVRCEHCARKIFSIVGEAIVIHSKHGSDHHTTVVSLAELGLKRIGE